MEVKTEKVAADYETALVYGTKALSSSQQCVSTKKSEEVLHWLWRSLSNAVQTFHATLLWSKHDNRRRFIDDQRR